MRYAFRTVVKNPGFSAVAIATLATGIGLNVALFGVFNTMLFRPLPVQDPGRLVAILSTSTEPDRPHGHLTYPDFEDFRARRDVLADAFAFTQANAGLAAGGHAVRVRVQIVTTNMFDVLGVRAIHGRTFGAADAREQSVVISYDTWQRLFGGDESAVGRSVTLNGRQFTIVGVAARGFIGPDRFEPTDLWIPLGAHSAVLADGAKALDRDNWWLTVIGRLASDVSRRQAEAVLRGVASGISASLPETHKGISVRVAKYHGTADDTRGQVAPIAALVMSVTVCVLLIACANVAALLVSRAAARHREIGIRLAIGASRAALTRQLLAESLVLAGAAGVAGLILALWGSELIVQFAAIPIAMDPTPDWRVLLFTTGISLVAGVAFGLAPALRASGLPVMPSLRGEPAADARPRRSRLQRALIVGQLALSLVLLAAAGILIRGLSAAWYTDVGFQFNDRVAISTDLRLQNYDSRQASAFHARALEVVRAIPGVSHAAIAHLVPFGGRVFVYGVSLPGRPQDDNARPERVSVNRVSTDFFKTMDVRILRGRDFTASDLRPGADAAIVSDTMARRFWPEGDAIGQRFSIDGSGGPFRTIVGVARDVRIDEFTERPWPAAWLPYQPAADELVILAASSRPPAQVLREIEGAVRSIDGRLPLYSARPLREYVAERLDTERALSRLLSICGALAVALAGLGLYGVTAYGVTRRTREIGVRMALGADRSDVLQLFLREGLRVALVGLAWGTLPAIAVTYALSGMFVGVFPVDPVTLVSAAAILMSATLLAAYLPARRATLVDPLVALRSE